LNLGPCLPLNQRNVDVSASAGGVLARANAMTAITLTFRRAAMLTSFDFERP
jgi:hypothetical protein